MFIWKSPPALLLYKEYRVEKSQMIHQCIYKKRNLLFPACLTMFTIRYNTAVEINIFIQQKIRRLSKSLVHFSVLFHFTASIIHV